jgi:hypothetical protein
LWGEEVAILGFELGFMFTRQALYHLSHSSSPEKFEIIIIH